MHVTVPKQFDDDARSPVYAATLSRNKAAIQRLTQADADVNIAAVDGTNPLSQCVKFVLMNLLLSLLVLYKFITNLNTYTDMIIWKASS